MSCLYWSISLFSRRTIYAKTSCQTLTCTWPFVGVFASAFRFSLLFPVMDQVSKVFQFWFFIVRHLNFCEGFFFKKETNNSCTTLLIIQQFSYSFSQYNSFLSSCVGLCLFKKRCIENITCIIWHFSYHLPSSQQCFLFRIRGMEKKWQTTFKY